MRWNEMKLIIESGKPKCGHETTSSLQQMTLHISLNLLTVCQCQLMSRWKNNVVCIDTSLFSKNDLSLLPLKSPPKFPCECNAKHRDSSAQHALQEIPSSWDLQLSSNLILNVRNGRTGEWNFVASRRHDTDSTRLSVPNKITNSTTKCT